MAVLDQNVENIVFINNSRTTWTATILMSFLSFSDNLLQNAHIIFFFFQNSVDSYVLAHKTCSILLWGALPP